MKNSKLGRILLLLACAVLLVCLSVGATLAYLTSSDTNVNTFTVGNVEIILDEAEVTDDGRSYLKDHDQRVKKNSYHLQPGQTYLKDPTVTVKANSENCYVRMLVTVNDVTKLDKAFPVENSRNEQYWWENTNGTMFMLETIVKDYYDELWVMTQYSENDNVGTYEFRYRDIIQTSTKDEVLTDLFTAIVVPGTLNNSEAANLADLEITVVAQAIQSDSFANADAAWEAFAQNYHDFDEAADKAAIVNPKTETEGEE